MEHVSTSTLLIILVIMVLVSAYFSASETGMMTLNRYRLRHQAKQGNRAARPPRREIAAANGPTAESGAYWQ